ncbi:CBS and ACT domain-containing protein [Lacticigenium naphthae]|uniref:CBS and ACT domain-containing protein n=1 Tax=Lacticigenium naphthae TaxID=515351 RepID=UPI0003FBA26E|nr:CBS and ACT domain-containing protein [Lacticigenium naphthae]
MNVEHYMTKNVITVSPDTIVLEALDIMKENHFHRLPIVKDDQLVGLITEGIVQQHSPSRATSMSIHEMNYLLNRTRVEQLMEKTVITTSKDTLIEEAALIMREKDVSVLPVVDENNHVVGIITEKDIFSALIDLTGYNDPGARLVISISKDQVGVLEKITTILAEANIGISHLFVQHPGEKIEVTIQIDHTETEEVEKILEANGYPVVQTVNK